MGIPCKVISITGQDQRSMSAQAAWLHTARGIYNVGYPPPPKSSNLGIALEAPPEGAHSKNSPMPHALCTGVNASRARGEAGSWYFGKSLVGLQDHLTQRLLRMGTRVLAHDVDR